MKDGERVILPGLAAGKTTVKIFPGAVGGFRYCSLAKNFTAGALKEVRVGRLWLIV